ncbi:MAG: CHRD domain-containing protein, partial [Chloroflexi bacterium]|nr:CHRD domain-containing protein [Chloroflexota bacterium]
VPLSPPTTGSFSGCAEGVDPALIQAIITSPENYYVNVHNAEFPAGAVRGQLSNPGQSD